MLVEQKSRCNLRNRQIIDKVTGECALNSLEIETSENGAAAVNLLGVNFQKGVFLKEKGQGAPLRANKNFELVTKMINIFSVLGKLNSAKPGTSNGDVNVVDFGPRSNNMDILNGPPMEDPNSWVLEIAKIESSNLFRLGQQG
ncbi:hypothetical protein V6Z12_A02G072600 [Gossypium hirsutum]